MKLDRILVVDDEEICRLLISCEFGFSGLFPQLAEAGDGEQALELMRGGQGFDLILLDVNMPLMDGFEFLAELRRTMGAPIPPVAVLTSSLDPSDRARFEACPEVRAYLVKPFAAEHIQLLLRLDAGRATQQGNP